MLDLKFRFVKIETWDSEWRTFYPVTEQKLQNIITRYNPKNTYLSKNKFLFYKEHKSYRHESKLLEEYGLIDIDGQKFSNKKECRDYFMKILKILLRKKIQIEEIVQTNDVLNGFQILISPCSAKELSILAKTSPFRRIDRIVFDLKRVRRLSGTLNGNRGCCKSMLLYSKEAKYLNISVLKDFISLLPHRLSQTRPQTRLHGSSDGFNALGMPLENDLQPLEPVLTGNSAKVGISSKNKADDIKGKNPFYPRQNKGRASGQEEVSLPPYFAVKQIQSSIQPLKSLYVCVMKFNRKMPEKRLVRLQKAYNLGDVYVFRNHAGYCYISPKAFSPQRLGKIYRKARCWKSLNELDKFRNNWIYCSNIIDIHKKKILNTLEFLGVYEQEANGWHSRAHLDFLGKYYFKPYSHTIGSEKPRVYTAVFESEKIIVKGYKNGFNDSKLKMLKK